MRDFKAAMIVVMARTNINRKDLQFPLVYSSIFGKTSVRELDLTERAKNVLGRNGISTMKDLMDSFDRIERFRSCGKQTVREIKNQFLQRWYETITDDECTKFWEEFIIMNA